MTTRRLRFLRRQLGVGVATFCVLASSTAAFAQDKLPSAVSTAEVAKQVRSSLSISKVPKVLATPLTKMSTDHVDRYYPTLKIGCYNYSAACTFGSAKAKKTLVLLGDSHASMWAPAVIPTALAAGYKVVVLWYPNCPAADVTPFNLGRGSLDANCVTWHHRIFSDIAKAKPNVVILSEATSLAQSDASTLFSPEAWQSGLEKTITALKSSSTKILMLSDIPVRSETPSTCLARNLTTVQTCTTPLVNADPALRQLTAAENAAAVAKGAKFVSLTSLICASSCSPIVGTHVTYFDTNHLASSYAATIRTAVWAALAKAIG